MSGITLSASARQNLLSLQSTAAILTVATVAVVATPALAQDPTVVSGTTVHGGQILSDFVAWAATAFGTAIATFVTGWVYRGMKAAGLDITQQQRDMLQQIIVNGLNDAASKAQANLGGNEKLDLNVQKQVVADAITYVQQHGAATITALGLDPHSGQAVDAIRARIATAIVDDKTPTNPVVTSAAVH